MRFYMIVDKRGNPVRTRKEWVYSQLSTAKNAAKAHIKHKNRRIRDKSKRLSFEDFKVVEYITQNTESHPL